MTDSAGAGSSSPDRFSGRARAARRSEPGAITRGLIETAPALIRWCTPSLLEGEFGITDPFASDLSVSYAPAGSMLEHSGWFAEAEAFVAGAQGSDKALLVPGGSTAANQIVVRSFVRNGCEGVVLVDRQAHHSFINALNSYGVAWQYLDVGRWDEAFECPRPVQPRDVARSIVSLPGRVAAVYVVSPTYNGEIANVAGIRRVIDRLAEGALLHVDEAWGAHLAFHPELAPNRAVLHADLVSQSTHKAGGALQPGAVLLANDGPMSWDALDAAYRDVMSTSASFIITASIETAHHVLRRDGRRLIDRSITHTRRLAAKLRERIPALSIYGEERPDAPLDPTKLTVALPPGCGSGYDVQKHLAESGVVIEKATPATVTFLATFGLTPADVDATVDATVAAIESTGSAGWTARLSVGDPFAAQPARPVVAPPEVIRIAIRMGHVVPADQAIGQVAAEAVEAYPPGVAVIAEGFPVTAGALDWLHAVVTAGGSIVARDPALTTLRVLP